MIPKNYQVAQICLNGHVVTASIKSDDDIKGKFCEDCGKETIIKCIECGEYIKGRWHSTRVALIVDFDPPKFCYGCGNPHPWTKAGIEALEEFIDFEEKLSKDDKEKLKKSINDIINETPRSQLASMLFKGALIKMRNETAKGMKDIIFKIATEKVKDAISTPMNMP